MLSTSGQSGPALKPDCLHTGTEMKPVVGSSNHLDAGNNLKISNMIGAAVLMPVKLGRPSPVVLPTQTTMQYFLVKPTAQPSRKPKLVPVFQAMRCAEENNPHKPSSP